MSKRALVLSGGGVVGIAWETGLMAGLVHADVKVADADLIVGTSAGSIVGAMLASGFQPSELLDELTATLEHEIADLARFDMAALGQLAQKFVGQTEITQEVRREIGALALSAQTMDEEQWVAPFAERLAGRTWPEQRLIVTAVDVATGEFAAWDRESGADLARAVASSCAVPALFPPVTINGHRYMDGGIRSVNNADLAQGYDTVLVVAFLNMFSRFGGPLAATEAAELNELRASGSRVEVVAPDEAAVAAFGLNPMDPAGRVPAVEAGLRQAGELADKLRTFWSTPVAVERS